MIEINDTNGLSRLLFLSDLYEMVLGVEGKIIHIECNDSDNWLWCGLREIYESDEGRVILDLYAITNAEAIAEALARLPSVVALAYFDERCDPSLIGTVLEAIVPFLTRGSVLAFNYPDAAVGAINEVIGLNNLAMQRWYHSRRDCYAIV